jgi:type IV pilus assembly protein PilW
MSHRASRQAGFSIIEFMIAITLSLLVLAALSGAFVASSRSRAEVERANEQMENGRFALQILTDDVELAGFLSHLNVPNAFPSHGLPAALPDPCDVDLADLNDAILMHVQGYDSLPTGDPALPTCITDYKDKTDIVVIRRTATCVAGAANCAWVPNAPYFQASLCANQIDPLLQPTPEDNWFQLARYTGTTTGPAANTQPAGGFGRLQRDCTKPAESRQYLTHIYYVANNDQAGDKLPTLKRAELGGGAAPAFTVVSLAHGIENMQVQYGIDADGNGAPETYTSAPANVAQWSNVVTLRMHLLAKNTQETRDYKDIKTYRLAGVCTLDANNDNTCEPPNDKYKRHVYETLVRLNNPAGRRER